MKRLLSIFLPVLVFLFPHLGVGQPTNHPLRTISIEVTVPNPTWRVAIQEVYVKGDRLLVVSTLSRDPDSMAAQVISKASDSVRIPAPDFPVEHYILGRTFHWAKEPHHFPQDRAELQKILQSAKKIYSRSPAP